MSSQNERPINVVKMLVDECIDEVMESIGVENTSDNREDVMALALNDLPAKYVNTAGGRLYTHLVDNYRVQYETDVVRSLVKAAIKVKESPR